MLLSAPPAGTRCPQLSINISCPQGAQLQTNRLPLLLLIDGTDRRTDERTLDGYIDPAPHTVRTASIILDTVTKTHTHTHTHSLNGPLSGTTRVSRYQKGKTKLQTDNHASTPPLSFLQAGCPSCRPTNSVKAPKGFTVTKRQLKTYGSLSVA